MTLVKCLDYEWTKYNSSFSMILYSGTSEITVDRLETHHYVLCGEVMAVLLWKLPHSPYNKTPGAT